MKHLIQLRLGLLLTLALSATFSMNNMVFSQTQMDTVLINESVLNYLEGLENNDSVRVAKAMYPDLAKRVIKKDKNTGTDKLGEMTAAELVHYSGFYDFTKFYKTGVDPKEKIKVDVII